MNGYTKLFNSILASTVWDLPATTCKVWITMMSMADQDGEVHASIPGLALLARVTREDAIAALEAFLAPDPDSRSQEHEGRRIEKIDGGWKLINHAKYRNKLSPEDRKARGAARAAKHREKKTETAESNKSNKSNSGNDIRSEADQKQIRSEADTEQSEKPLASLGTAPNPKQATRDLIAIHCEEWELAYGAKYPVTGGDAGTAKRLIAANPWLTPEAIRYACKSYVRCTKPYFADNRHPLRLFCENLQEFSAPRRTVIGRSGPDLTGRR